MISDVGVKILTTSHDEAQEDNMNVDADIVNARQIIGEIQKGRRGVVPMGRDVFERLSARMNDIVMRLNDECKANLHVRVVGDSDFSFSGMFATATSMDALEKAAEELLDFLVALKTPDHAPGNTFRCFKIDSLCPKAINPHRFKFFIATSFSDEYKAVTTQFIEKLEKDFGISHEQIFRADNYLATRDIMCKVCQGLQESECVVANISGFNPNVMLELGMAMGLCKEIILLKDSRVADQEVSDIKGLEYIAYSTDDEWYERMTCILKGKQLV